MILGFRGFATDQGISMTGRQNRLDLPAWRFNEQDCVWREKLCQVSDFETLKDSMGRVESGEVFSQSFSQTRKNAPDGPWSDWVRGIRINH
jgi:hypothetical protein